MRGPVRWLFIPAVAAALAAVASGPIKAQSPDSLALVRLEDGWAQALVKRDGAFFSRTLAPGFVYTEDNRLMTRDEVIHEAITGADTVTAAHNEGMVVHLFGTTGVVTGLLVIEGRSNRIPFVRRYRFTDTWMKQTPGWRIIAAQDYLIPR
jgi:hypothetical protein